MNRQGFGFGSSGRPSGIRPPSAYNSGMVANSRPKTQSTSSTSSIPSTASSRKAKDFLFNLPGSGGGRLSGAAQGGQRQSIFGSRNNAFSSGRKSVTAKLGPLFGLTPQHNRPSYQPNTGSSAQSSRRSSIGGSRHVQDNRPLSDSAFQRQCVTKLIAFLTDNPIQVYPHQLSKAFATRPTVKEISNIFEFLFLCFGLKSKVTPMETEIPKLMASLEYPFPVKKSDLVSFTSGRALGSVLGMLEWLVDSIQYLIAMDPIRTFYPNFEGEIDIKSELVNLCLSNCANGIDVNAPEVDNYLEQLLEKKFGTEDDYERLVDESEALEQEVQRLDEEIQNIRDLPQTVQTYEADIKSYDNYMIEMKAHIESNQQVLQTLTTEQTERLASTKKLEEQKRQLKCKVEEQEFDIEEAVLAKDRKIQLENEIKQELALIEDIKKGIRSSKLECSKHEDIIKKMHSSLDSFVIAMNDLVDSPVMTSYCSSVKELLTSTDWTEVLDGLKAIKTGETNGTDINALKVLFSQKVHSLKIAIVQQLSSLKGSVGLSEQQKINELNLLVDGFEKQLKQNEIQVLQMMSEMETKRKEQVLQIAALQSECDRTRQLLSEFDGKTKRSHKEEKENLFDLRKEVEEREREYESEAKERVAEFEASVSVNKKGLQEYCQKLDQLLAEEHQKRKELKAIQTKISSSTAGADKERRTRRRDKRE